MSTLRLTCLALALVFLGARAHAQGIGPGGLVGGDGGGGGHHGQHADDSDDAKKPGPPPSIPGAVQSPDSVVPASKTAKDLDPNAALFDAIDRGDLAAAREALNRGADLNARNVLGQRPIDMSVDLSRNPITFLLLSLRAEDADTGQAAAAADQPTPTTKATVTAKGRHRHGRAPAPVEVASSAPSASTDAPQPSAGFLGFGSH